MSDIYMNLESLNKTDIIPSEQLTGLGMNNGSSDCNDCHYISSDCTEPLF